ncbi:hypothetical protein CCC_02120 [Paramagnetospirillum magnetotacticum MS-1]|uniref:Uncharacterized protein n=1 Tax=Paramagnetospirillum magnetotacticum MS-1 TaxID=272627 RepID=A0A0C2YVE6_PARME|nr:hypothetical protein CCC_02120 [Paramagnetospirillum magnetotacticum MS-1]
MGQRDPLIRHVVPLSSSADFPVIGWAKCYPILTQECNVKVGL